MIPSQTVSDQILTAELKLANMTLANIAALQGGSLSANWIPIRNAQRAVNCVQRQYELGDTSSTPFLKAWTCLSDFVGTYAGGAIDPNAQNPGTIIEIVTPANFTPWLDVPYSDFDVATQQPDGGRYIFNYAPWKGLNPSLALISPAETALQYGIDYILVGAGGIQLLNTSTVLPYIYDGMVIRATSYA